MVLIICFGTTTKVDNVKLNNSPVEQLQEKIYESSKRNLGRKKLWNQMC